MTSRAKNILILALSILVLWQSMDLWVNSIAKSNINFNISFEKKKDLNELELYYTPARIVIKKDREYYVIYGDEYNAHINILKRKISEKKGIKEINKLEYKKNSIEFEYKFLLQGKELINKDIEFNRIRLSKEKEKINIEMYDSENKEKVYVLGYDDVEVVKMYDAIYELNVNEIKYKKNRGGYTIDIKDKQEVNNIEVKNPYLSKGMVVRSSVKEKVKGFFTKDTNTIESSVKDEIITFSNAYTVVRYYMTGILEYGYYNNEFRDNKLSIVEKFTVAKEFLKKDESIKNSYYLENYEEKDDKIIFNFNYSINGLPIYLSNEQKDKYRMENFLEITVENGEVTKYKKIVYNFIKSNKSMEYKQSKIEEDIKKMDYDEIELGYDFNLEREITMYWKLWKGERTYLKSTKFERTKN